MARRSADRSRSRVCPRAPPYSLAALPWYFVDSGRNLADLEHIALRIAAEECVGIVAGPSRRSFIDFAAQAGCKPPALGDIAHRKIKPNARFGSARDMAPDSFTN